MITCGADSRFVLKLMGKKFIRLLHTPYLGSSYIFNLLNCNVMTPKTILFFSIFVVCLITLLAKVVGDVFYRFAQSMAEKCKTRRVLSWRVKLKKWIRQKQISLQKYLSIPILTKAQTETRNKQILNLVITYMLVFCLYCCLFGRIYDMLRIFLSLYPNSFIFFWHYCIFYLVYICSSRKCHNFVSMFFIRWKDCFCGGS